MSSIARRTATLGFARLAKQSVIFVTPIFLVRLLTVDQFGEYRDFLLYSTIILMIVEFCANSSLAYFVPREPARENVYFTQTTMFVLITSVVAAILVLSLGSYIPSEGVRAYKYELSLYTIVLCNLDSWEVLWVAKKQAIKVVYYSLTRLIIRTMSVVLAAYYFREVGQVIWTLVAVEAGRLVIMTVYAARRKLLVAICDSATVKAQLAFFGPLGASNLLYTANIYMGQLYISTVMGPAMLGVYTIGSYLQPIVRIFRGSIGDVIMPEIASKKDEPPKVALVLWQRATVVYCVVMMPMAMLLFYYADVVVSVLFTRAYIEAVPVFQIFVFLLIRECFDFALPLRIVNRTDVFFYISALTVVANLVLMLILFRFYGILGPALAAVGARFLLAVGHATYTKKYCEYTIAELLPWLDIAKVAILTIACATILVLGNRVALDPFVRMLVFSAIYTFVYIVALINIGIDDVRTFILRALRFTR